MPIPQAYFRWNELTSTGASTLTYGDQRELRDCRNITLIAQAHETTDTAVIGIESAIDSTGKFERLGSTGISLSSGVSATIQFTGPLGTIRPYIIAKTGSTTRVSIVLMGN